MTQPETFYTLSMLIAFIYQAIIDGDSEEYSVAQTAEHGGSAMQMSWVPIPGNAWTDNMFALNAM